MGDLITASFEGNVEEVIRLLENPGIDLNFQDDEGNTAMLRAAHGGEASRGRRRPGRDRNELWGQGPHLEIIELLLDAGANPDIMNNEGESIMLLGICGRWMAGETSSKDLVDLLLQKRVDPNFIQDDAPPPLEMAQNFRKYDIARSLIYAGADPNIGFEGNIPIDDPEIRRIYMNRQEELRLEQELKLLEAKQKLAFGTMDKGSDTNFPKLPKLKLPDDLLEKIGTKGPRSPIETLNRYEAGEAAALPEVPAEEPAAESTGGSKRRKRNYRYKKSKSKRNKRNKRSKRSKRSKK